MKEFNISTSGIHFEDWGLIDYQASVMGQLEVLQRLAEGKAMETVVFCSHPPIVTLGRATKPGDVFGWDGPTLEASRGGRATYHGPSQVVVYAIMDLNRQHHERPPREILGFLRDFEKCIVEALKDLGIEAQGKSVLKQSETKKDPLDLEETGVWVGRKKIASLGIAVKKWITYHGAAINLEEDPKAFVGLKPCGFDSSTMVSVEKVSGKKISRAEFIKILKEKIQLYL